MLSKERLMSYEVTLKQLLVNRIDKKSVCNNLYSQGKTTYTTQDVNLAAIRWFGGTVRRHSRRVARCDASTAYCWHRNVVRLQRIVTSHRHSSSTTYCRHTARDFQFDECSRFGARRFSTAAGIDVRSTRRLFVVVESLRCNARKVWNSLSHSCHPSNCCRCCYYYVSN